MKNKTLTLSMIGIIILGGYGALQAGQNTSTATGVSTTQVVVPVDWKAEAAKKGEQALSAREWIIHIWPADAKGKLSVETDVLVFANGKVTSKNLSAQGYSSSNYGLFVSDDGRISWETMQVRGETPKPIDLAFLRAQLFQDGSMKGGITLQPNKGAKKRFAFATQMPAATGK